MLCVVNGHHALVTTLLRSYSQPAALIGPNCQQVTISLQSETKHFLSAAVHPQVLPSGIIGHGIGTCLCQHRVSQRCNLLQILFTGKGVVVYAGRRSHHQTVVQIGHINAVATAVGKGLCLTADSGLDRTQRQPPLNGIQVVAIPVQHQKKPAKNESRCYHKGQQPHKNILFFLLRFFFLHTITLTKQPFRPLQNVLVIP